MIKIPKNNHKNIKRMPQVCTWPTKTPM